MNLDLNRFVNDVIDGQMHISHLKSPGPFKSGEFDDSKIIGFFTELADRKIYLNSKVAEKVADCCQLLNEERNVASVSLEQIGKIYRVLTELNPLDLDFYESYFHFLDTIMDQPAEARKMLSTGINSVEEN